MKRALTTAVLIFLAPAVLCAASFQCVLPPGIGEAHLLSEGTGAVLDYLKAGYQAEIEDAIERHRVRELEKQAAKVRETLAAKKRAYDDKFSSLRREYLSSLTITLESIDVALSPSSSALGDVTFSYTAKNNSDKIVTDIIYLPLIKDISLPTTTSLVLEFISPTTLISGIGPGETLTNRGHDPERFSFFISELSPEEIAILGKDAGGAFDIEILDMHFADRKGYKGQVAVKDFTAAFSRELGPFLSAIESAEADSRARERTHANALAAFNAESDRAAEKLGLQLTDLRKSSVRHSARPDKKNRFIFEGVSRGSYYLYASDRKGGAVFEKIEVKGESRQADYTDMGKDPFVP
jgi:hypothetical protein